MTACYKWEQNCDCNAKSKWFFLILFNCDESAMCIIIIQSFRSCLFKLKRTKNKKKKWGKKYIFTLQFYLVWPQTFVVGYIVCLLIYNINVVYLIYNFINVYFQLKLPLEIVFASRSVKIIFFKKYKHNNMKQQFHSSKQVLFSFPYSQNIKVRHGILY